MWAAVRQVTGKSHNDHVTVDEITATSLNLHYAAVSTDTDYKVPSPKQTSSIHPHIEYLSEWEVFRQLDTLLSTGMPSSSVGCRVAQLVECLVTSGYPDGSSSGGPGSNPGENENFWKIPRIT